MKKSTLFMIVSVVLALTLSLGGTLAYLTDTDYDTNVMVLGNIDIEQHETDRTGAEFKQGQMLLPMVGSAADKDDAGYPAPQNYIDKIVTVENVGNYDAYVRTFIAIPVYSYDENLDNVNNASLNVLHWNGYSDSDDAREVATQYIKEDGTVVAGLENNWHWGKQDQSDWPGNADGWNNFKTTIGDQEYNVFVVTNLKKVAPGERTAPNMIGLYLDSKVDFNGEFYTYEGKKIDNFDGVVEVLVATQAVQYDTGWADAFEALDTAFGAPSGGSETEPANHPWTTEKGQETLPSNPSNDQELENDLTADKKNITVVMDKDMTYDVAAWANEMMGGEKTETITIIGNGHTLTFNNTNSDWNNIVTNGAKLILSDVVLNNAGYDATSGTWNAHDIVFNCPVELNNVNAKNALAFEDDATLKNVTITDDSTGDAYLIWICANGQTVNIDGLYLDATGTAGNDRGIKIADEYIKDPADRKLVTLNVSNAKFVTEKKAAIVVSSTAGANITLDNVDISKTVDTTNPVWIDNGNQPDTKEPYKDYAGLVTVTGGSVIVEP